jgi:hypothetical protein
MSVDTGRSSLTQTLSAVSSASAAIPLFVGQTATLAATPSGGGWTAGSVWAEWSRDGSAGWSRIDGGELAYDKATTGVGISTALQGMPPGVIRARTNGSFAGAVDVVLTTY